MFEFTLIIQQDIRVVNWKSQQFPFIERILMKHKMHPYSYQVVQSLYPGDFRLGLSSPISY